MATPLTLFLSAALDSLELGVGVLDEDSLDEDSLDEVDSLAGVDSLAEVDSLDDSDVDSPVLVLKNIITHEIKGQVVIK